MSNPRSTPVAPEPQWRGTKLSFERPYKDDSGHRIPVLYDLTPEGERIYEPCVLLLNPILLLTLA
jgi:hypothetical protein